MKPRTPHVLGALAFSATASVTMWACVPAVAPPPGTPGAAVPESAAKPESGATAQPAALPATTTKAPPGLPEPNPPAKAAASKRTQVRDKWHGEYRRGVDFKADRFFEDKARDLKVEKLSLKSGVVGPTAAIAVRGSGTVAVKGRAAREIAVVNTINPPMSDAPNTLALTDATTGGTLNLTADPEFVRFTGKSAKGSFVLVVNPDGTLTLDGKPTDGVEGTARRLAEGVAADASPEQLAMLDALLVSGDEYAAQVGLATLFTFKIGLGQDSYKVLASDGFDLKPLVRAVLAKRLAP